MLSLPPAGWGRSLALAALLHSTVVLADDAVVTLSPDDAVASALSQHPHLRRADGRVQIAQGARGDATLFSNNPSLSGWVSTDKERAGLTVKQPISITGEGFHTRAAASHQTTSAELHLTRARREVAAATRLAYAQAAVANGKVTVAQEGVALAERLADAVSRKHDAEEVSLLELRLTRLAQVQASVRLAEARRDQAEALRALAGWTLQPLDASVVLDDPLTAAPVAEPADSPLERTDLSAARASVQAAEQQLKAQRAAVMPAVAIGLTVNVEDAQTWVGPAFSTSLPVFQRNQQGRASAAAALTVAEASAQSLGAVATTEQATAATRSNEAERLFQDLRDDMTRDALLALQSIEAGVLAGELDLPTALLLQAQVLDGQMATLELRGLLASARLDLLLANDDDRLLGGAS